MFLSVVGGPELDYGGAVDFYGQFNHSWLSSWAMAVELNALKMYWAHSLTGMHDLAMRHVIDGADALVSITSGPTKIEASLLPSRKLHLPHAAAFAR